MLLSNSAGPESVTLRVINALARRLHLGGSDSQAWLSKIRSEEACGAGSEKRLGIGAGLGRGKRPPQCDDMRLEWLKSHPVEEEEGTEKNGWECSHSHLRSAGELNLGQQVQLACCILAQQKCNTCSVLLHSLVRQRSWN